MRITVEIDGEAFTSAIAGYAETACPSALYARLIAGYQLAAERLRAAGRKADAAYLDEFIVRLDMRRGAERKLEDETYGSTGRHTPD